MLRAVLAVGARGASGALWRRRPEKNCAPVFPYGLSLAACMDALPNWIERTYWDETAYPQGTSPRQRRRRS